MTLKQLMREIEEARDHYSPVATREFLDNLLVRFRNEGVSDEPAPEPSADRRFSELNEQIQTLSQSLESCSRRLDKRLSLLEAVIAKLRSI